MTAAGAVAERPFLGVLTAERARAIGWALFAVGTVLRVADLWLASRLGPDSVQFSLGAGFQAFAAAIAMGTACSVVGAIIVSRRPGNAIGWIYVFVGIGQAFLTAGLAYAGLTVPTQPGLAALALVWLNGIGDFSLPFSVVALLLALYPDGRLVGPGWRVVLVLAIAGGVIRALEVGLGLDHLALLPGYPNPYQASGPIGEILAASSRVGVGAVLLALGAIGAGASLVVRYRRAPLDGRRQIQWLLLAGAVVFICSLPLAYSQLTGGASRPPIDLFAVSFASLSLVPLAMLVAITRYRLYEIDRLVNRALVYGSLTAILAGVFTAGVGLAQRLFVSMTGESSDVAIVLTTLVVATLYAPLRKRLEALVDRHFKYDDARFGAYRHELSRLLSLVDPVRASERLISEAVAELGAAGGAVLSAGGAPTATAGIWPQVLVDRLPIPGGAGVLGAIVVGPRLDGRPHDPARLDELQRVAGMVALATRTTDPAEPTPAGRARTATHRGPATPD